MINTSFPSFGRFYFYLVWRHKFKCMTMIGLSLMWAVTEAYAPYLLKILIDMMTETALVKPAITEPLYYTAVGLILMLLGKHVILRASDLLTEGFIVPQIQGDIRVMMMGYALDHSHSYYQRNLSGDVASRINLVADSFWHIYDAWEHWIFPVLVSFGISIWLMWKTHPFCALFVVGWLLVALVLTGLLSVLGMPYAQEHAYRLHTLIAHMVNILQNVFTVKMFARNKHETTFVRQLQQKENNAIRRLESFLTIIRGVLSLSCIGLLALLTRFLLQGWVQGVITVGDVTFVLTTCFSMLTTVWWLSSYMVSMYKHIGIASEAFTVMSEPHEIVDLPNAKPLKVAHGEIEFENVSFTYESESSAATIFTGLNLKISAGEKVGLVGFSGSGKTTLIHLIMRFFDVTDGAIKIDGQNIAEVTQHSLRDNIALIPQEPMLFARSLRENLTYGRLRASQRELVKASRAAHVSSFVRYLPEKYNTVVSERGQSLSGGQRQRVAIARAILKNAPILILDEATSALDSITEQRIQKSFDYLMRNRTAIVIAHRLGTLQNMDRLLVFDGGQIVEQGSHAELLELGGYYAQLWTMQVGGIIPDHKPEEDDEQEEESE